ncbi:hypothetical protein RRF57_007024 [Xylaria bambusicola]|uniref:Uncharacterized protein n=1 Tax=Xylaria bambusicola TaxID=326684 RepID=A0AAN7YZF8_9PEZI
MAPQTDPNLDADDPPPSYAEATSTSRHRHRNSNSNRIDARRYTLANISSTIIHPVYSHVRSRIDGPVFPQAFSLYCQSLQHYTIGEGQMSPLYAVSTHGPGMQPDMVIHRGISRDCTLFPTWTIL